MLLNAGVEDMFGILYNTLVNKHEGKGVKGFSEIADRILKLHNQSHQIKESNLVTFIMYCKYILYAYRLFVHLYI